MWMRDFDWAPPMRSMTGAEHYRHRSLAERSFERRAELASGASAGCRVAAAAPGRRRRPDALRLPR
jgi:hypothetical protein